LSIKEHARFQLEATKLGRMVIFQVTVYSKKVRRKERLFAETQCSDPYHFIIQFVIKDANSTEEIIQRFMAQLRHRAFLPLRFRHNTNGRWDHWLPAPKQEIDSVA
jgi:hypothetical protein